MTKTKQVVIDCILKIKKEINFLHCWILSVFYGIPPAGNSACAAESIESPNARIPKKDNVRIIFFICLTLKRCYT